MELSIIELTEKAQTLEAMARFFPARARYYQALAADCWSWVAALTAETMPQADDDLEDVRLEQAHYAEYTAWCEDVDGPARAHQDAQEAAFDAWLWSLPLDDPAQQTLAAEADPRADEDEDEDLGWGDPLPHPAIRPCPEAPHPGSEIWSLAERATNKRNFDEGIKNLAWCL